VPANYVLKGKKSWTWTQFNRYCRL